MANGGVSGAGEFRTSLHAAAGKLTDVALTMRDVGQTVLGAVDPPQRNGALASTVRIDPDSDGVDIIAGSSAVRYAGVIDQGWPGHHIKAQHYIGKAVDKTETRIADHLESHGIEALSDVRGA